MSAWKSFVLKIRKSLLSSAIYSSHSLLWTLKCPISTLHIHLSEVVLVSIVYSSLFFTSLFFNKVCTQNLIKILLYSSYTFYRPFYFVMFSICFTRYFIDTGFEIKPISIEGSIFENSFSLISNADIKVTLTLGCSSFILVTSSYPFI